MHRSIRARARAAALTSIISLIALFPFSTSVLAQATADLQPRHRFQIPAEGLEAALAAFSAQSHIHLVTSGTRTHVLSPGVSGELSSQNALAALLRGTGMSFRQVDGETLVIAPAQTAQLRPTQFQLIGDVDSTALATQPTAAAAPAAAAPTELTEVQVTGSRIIRQGYEAPTPVASIGLQDLEDAAQPNISNTISELPQFQGSETGNSTGTSDLVGFQTELNLRNLNAIRTLVLFDGRRLPSDNITNVVDVGLIPDALVQRVDVVTGGASAVYGSDAVAGVVNYVLDTNFTGIKGVVQGGVSAYGDGASDKIQLTVGTAFLDGRLHLIASGEQDYQAEILGSSRAWNLTGELPVNNPAYTPTNGLPAYINAPCCVGFPGYYPGGIIISGPLKGVDFGVGGVVGQYNFGSGATGNFNVGGDWQASTMAGSTSLSPMAMATHFFARMGYDLTPDIQAYVQFLNGQDRSDQDCCFDYYTAGLPINVNNPYLPASVAAQATGLGLFTLNVAASLRFPLSLDPDGNGGFGNQGDRGDDTYTVGLKGKFSALNSTWNWNAWGQMGIAVEQYYVPEESNTTNFMDAIQAVTVGTYYPGYSAAAYPNPLGIAKGTITCLSNLLPKGAAGGTSNCVPYDLFGLGVASPAAIEYTQGGPFERQEQHQNMLGGDIAGDPFSTWAGPVSVAADLEYRNEGISGFDDPISRQSGWFSANLVPFFASEYVEEGALEAVVPVLKGAPGVQELDLNGAARATKYSVSGYVTTYKYGLEYTPITDVRLRGTASLDIRAPNLNDLYAPPQASHGTIADPFLGNASTGAYSLTPGNPQLKPEKAHEIELGIVLQPTEVPGLGATVDFYHIRVDDAINTLTNTFILQQCFNNPSSPYCALITSISGVPAIYTIPENIAEYLAEGVDYELDYRTVLSNLVASWKGSMNFHLTANDTMKLITDTGIPGPAESLNAAGSGNSPRWTAIGTLTYTLDPWHFSWTERFVDSELAADNIISCSSHCPTPVPAGFNTIAAPERMPTYFIARLNVNYTFMEHDQQTAEAFINVNNVFNKIPPYNYDNGVGSPTYHPITNAYLYDQTGLYVRVGIRFRL